ncbi:hypothetical protein FISHEDRAFT_29682, partial [Fistulina hepatica ATCC 64428]
NIGADCYAGVHGVEGAHSHLSMYVSNLVQAYACEDWIAQGNPQMWSSEICVAAASVADGLGIAQLRRTYLCSKQPSRYCFERFFFSQVYANVVGDCAWQSGGCPMTQQNFIDMVYGSISAYGGTNWPTSAQEVIDAFDTILDWTLTGTDTPYLNFNDWLHY